jgi:two-component system CheB/CheR fusion protein
MKVSTKKKNTKNNPDSEEELLERLRVAEDIVNAIKNGEVDAVVSETKKGLKVNTFLNADISYCVFYERMNEAAVTLSYDEIILFTNNAFSRLLDVPLNNIFLSNFVKFVYEKDVKAYKKMINNARYFTDRAVIRLEGKRKQLIPVNISAKKAEIEDLKIITLMITDLRKSNEHANDLKFED